MKSSKAQPILDALILNLGEIFAQIGFESSVVIDTFRENHKKMTQLAASTQHRKPALITAHKFRRMWLAVTAWDVRQSAPPQTIKIGVHEAKDKEFIDMLEDNLNRQHLCLFVQVFEAIEKYYKNLYGALGYLDNNLFQCKDFGEDKISELVNLDLKSFQNLVRNNIAQHNVKKILNNLRKVFPEFKKLEKKYEDKHININLRLWFGVAELFRHIIVHRNACIPENELITNIEKKTGESFTGHSKEVNKRELWILPYFKLKNGICYLWLIDRNRARPPYHGLGDKFNQLLKKLASHACLSYAIAMSHFNQKPFWEREKSTSTTEFNIDYICDKYSANNS